jgi:signal transduction histidine kinase
MNLFSISSILVVLSCLSIFILVSFKAKEKHTSLFFAAFCLVVANWGWASFKISLTASYEEALLWWKIGLISVFITPVMYTQFVFMFTKRKVPKFIAVFYLITIAFIIGSFINFNFLFGRLNFIFNQFYWIDPFYQRKILIIFFYIFFYWFVLGYAFYSLLKTFWSTSGASKMQLRYFIVISLFGWVGAEGGFFPALNYKIYPLANFSMAIYPVIMSYAILKYRLLDIKIALTRTSLFIAVYTLVLGLPFAIAAYFKNGLIQSFGPNWWMVPLAIMGLLATIGPSIYIYLQHRAEDRLMKEQRRYQESLKHAAVGMTRIHDLKRLLKLIAHIVTRKVGISFTAIYLYDEREGVYSLQVSHDKGRKTIEMISASQEIIQWFHSKGLPLVYEEIVRFAQELKDPIFKELETEMRLLEAELIIPSFLDKRLIGFIVLGAKNTGAMYSVDDLNVFQVLASQAALAIENAQFYSEAKEMQAQISQAEKMATVGTMADGLSHQINNRFYALSLIAGDTLDTIRLTDTKNCTPEVQAMVKEINAALERIQVNVMQGGEVVKGILRYTRKGDEGLAPLTLDQIIDGTLDMVQFKVKLQDFDIVRDYLKESPKIKGNLVQMQEVFFNFIDNAYDSMVERRTMLKEPGYRGKIIFSMKPEFNTIKIYVSDNGMGVKEEDMKRLFTPFFTTKVSSRKGTGLGLYVIRNIIIETHHGKISVQSEHKKGTTFTIELPIFQETSPGSSAPQNT